MTSASRTPKDAVTRAEKSVVRAAMGCVNAAGWAFNRRDGIEAVLFPNAVRRLEHAVYNLQLARKAAKRRRK